MKRHVFIAGIFIIVAALTVSVYSQSVSAIVPVTVNVAATVRIQPPAGSGGVAVEQTVEANTPKDFVLTLNEMTSIRHNSQRQRVAGAAASYNRGSVSLRLNAQSYQNAMISLHSLNGKRVLRGNTAASKGSFNMSRQNIAKGVYILSVKGASGNTFAMRLTHNGGKLNVNVTFAGDNTPALRKQASAAAFYGEWTIIATAAGRIGKSYKFQPKEGSDNATQNITLDASNEWTVDASWVPRDVCNERAADADLDKSKDDLGRPNAVVVKYSDGGNAEVTANWETNAVTWTVSGGHVVIDNKVDRSPDIDQVNLIVSGSTDNGSLKIYAFEQMTVYLNGAVIRNPTGPAINIQGKKTEINLVGGCDRKNYIEGKGTDPVNGEQAKGAIFSEKTLEFKGGGMLEMRSNDRHAIVTDENIRINNVDIVIHHSAGDGLHANNNIEISGGTVQILSVGDAIQSEREDNTLGVTISGGEITVRTTGDKSHGIAVEKDIWIYNDPKINITLTGAASKGLRARQHAEIRGGTLNVFTTGGQITCDTDYDDDCDSDDPTSSAAGIKARSFEMSGGSYTTVNRGYNSKGINVDNNTRVSGGTITARSHGNAILVRGNFTMTAGTIYAESSDKKTAIDVKGNKSIPPGITVIEETETGAI